MMAMAMSKHSNDAVARQLISACVPATVKKMFYDWAAMRIAKFFYTHKVMPKGVTSPRVRDANVGLSVRREPSRSGACTSCRDGGVFSFLCY
jgi:hypothetical protein